MDRALIERALLQRMLRLRPFRAEDEERARAAHEAMKADAFPFLLDYVPNEPWSLYLQRREANGRGEQLPVRFVSSTFLAATVEGALVGRISIRHELNNWLATYGGHIGYAVIPEKRRRGYATEILRQGLVVARALGIDDVLVTCDVDNAASAGVIERCGGAFESIASGDGTPKRRYWFR
jgi:predicted acetyltransferase